MRIDTVRQEQRDPVETLRTIYWYEGVRQRAGTETAYATERKAEGEAFGRNRHGDPYHRNKWVAYQKGSRTPRNGLVESVDGAFPGTASELRHVFWHALAPIDAERLASAQSLLTQLSPATQVLLAEARLTPAAACAGTVPHGRFLKKLQNRANLDALACVTVFLREAIVRGDSEGAWSLGNAAIRMLLALGAHLVTRRIGTRLFDLYADRFFNRLTYRGKRKHLDLYDFEASALLLDAWAWNRARKKSDPDFKKEMIHKSFILGGGFGLDLCYAMLPVSGPACQLSEASEKEIREFEAQCRIQEWSWANATAKDSTAKLPPLELWFSGETDG